MTIESDAKEHAQRVHARLFGEYVKPVTRVVRVEPAYNHLYDPGTSDKRPTPRTPMSQAAINALLDEDDQSWQPGYRDILRHYGETARRLRSSNRDKNIVSCRIAIARFLRGRGWSYPRIGEILNKDHSSVVYMLDINYRRSKRAREAGK